MTFVDVALLAFALVGHGFLWIRFYDWLHATSISQQSGKHVSRLCELLFLLIPLAILASAWWSPLTFAAAEGASVGWWIRTAYLIFCIGGAVWYLPPWLRHGLFRQKAGVLEANHTQVIDVQADFSETLAGKRATRLISRLRANQMFQLSVHEKILTLPGLSPAWDGFSIVHLSDLHFTGRIKREYFERVCEEANRLGGDLIAITGDLVDKPHCLEWLPSTLGRLKARHGVWYVLGNHDRLIDREVLHRVLAEHGLRYLGGRVATLDVDGRPLLLAGNELPWFRPAAEVSEHQRSEGELRVLLSHSPDQFPWAQRRDFDLVLAGHTHGGQISFPLLGPLVTCSRYGTRYISGTYEENGAVLHTSRGISGAHTIRLNCPPELAKLVLRAGSDVSRET